MIDNGSTRVIFRVFNNLALFSATLEDTRLAVLSRGVSVAGPGCKRGLFRTASVSGSPNNMRIQTTPPKTTMNHIVLRQPHLSAKAPPIIGANRGPQRGPM